MEIRLSPKGENNVLLNETWQEVPGMENARIFPIIRKPDVSCSNVFILNIGDYLIVIDTGNRQDITNTVYSALCSKTIDREKPVIIIFGHAHFDHIYQGLVDRRIDAVGNTVYVCHAHAVKPLMDGDATYIQSSLVDLPAPPFRIDIPLFSENPDEKIKIEEFLSGFSYIPELCTIHETIQLRSIRLVFPDKQELIFWEVPGHSPDSMAIQAGEMIHVGDIPFATNPGVAGIVGYNQCELDKTLERVRWILKKRPVSVILTGHGNAIIPAQLHKILDNSEKELKANPHVGVFDRKRVDIAMLHGMDLIDEAHRLFPVIAGKLMVLRYHLDELEEHEIAERLAEIIRDDEIDQLLSNFNAFYKAYTEGNKKDIEVVLRIHQTLQKIRSCLPKHEMEWIVDGTMLRRCENLCVDFLSTLQGIIPSATITALDPVDLIRNSRKQRITSRISDDELLESIDDEKAYRRNLILRLSENQCYANAEIAINLPENQVFIYADPIRLSDLFNAVVDYYETNKAGKITFFISYHANDAIISITPDPGCHPELPLSPSLLRSAGYTGGKVKKIPSREKEEIILAFQVAPIP